MGLSLYYFAPFQNLYASNNNEALNENQTTADYKILKKRKIEEM